MARIDPTRGDHNYNERMNSGDNGNPLGTAEHKAMQQAWRDNINGGQPAGMIFGSGKSDTKTVSKSGTSDTVNKMHVADIIAAMNGGGGSTPLPTTQAANQPAAPAPRSGKVAPVPMPANARPKPRAGGDPIDDALNQGFTMDQIIAGAAGAAAGAAAMKLFQGNKGGPVTGVVPTTGAKPPTGNTNILTRNGMVEGQPTNNPGANNVINTTFGTGQVQVVPKSSPAPGPRRVTGPQNILTKNGLTEGVPTMNTDINQQFYELFGIPMPGGPGEPRLLPGNGAQQQPVQATVPPLANNNSIPGPNQGVKQLGDMDSPTYRKNFGLNGIAMKAQQVIDTMEQYGITDPGQIGSFMDVSADPAVARVVRSALTSAF